MYRILISAAFLSLPVTLAQAQSCPAPEAHTDELDRLYGQLATAPTEEISQQIGQALWDVWLRAPDGKAQKMLMFGMQGRVARKYNDAESILSALVDYCPDYAEGWNQRAFVRYLKRDFAGALPDLERALELRPRHLGALSGKALVHMQMGDLDLADAELRKAWALNPWLPERHRLKRQGTDL